MLGLVLGPGEVLGVGLVVLGVSVPMPPALEPEVESPLEGESLGMPDDDPPDVDAPSEVPDEDVPDEDVPLEPPGALS